MTSIQGISERIFQRPIIVANDLQRMIYLGMLPNATVDMNTMRIIFDQRTSANPTIHLNVAVDGPKPEWSDPQSSFTKAEKLQPKTVECPGCGSSTLLQPGESKACQYCDSPLTYPKSG
ncbi:hypothetical protein [Paenibacillus tyrfis]|uniref:hypothetical protein n=1 Tax=Paenibacillus tyrfis TaxID=1501230 RepID=UPI0011806344|nr:hypothetical protein [Paenibacillus tyrfis]